jgi:hypothetical protein
MLLLLVASFSSSPIIMSSLRLYISCAHLQLLVQQL